MSNQDDFEKKLDELESFARLLGFDPDDCGDPSFQEHVEWLEHEESVSREGENGEVRLIRSEETGRASGVRYLNVDLEGTQYEGRIERIEQLHFGDTVLIRRDPDNEFKEDAVLVCNQAGESLGLIPSIISEGLSAAMDNGWETIRDARVAYIEPLSKRGPKAKKPILHVSFETELHSEIAEQESDPDLLEDAEAGDISAIDRLGMMYLNGDGVQPDPKQAAYWFRKGAEAGNALHMFNLGLFYAKGFGVPRDFALAAEWMQKAANAGDADALAEAELYRNLAEQLKQAETGDAEAQATVAEAYMKLGRSLDQAGPGSDYQESLKWAEKAAQQGNGRGMWLLALACEHGRGMPRDPGKALEWYRKGAELGDAACQNSLGTSLIKGSLGPKDSAEGFRWVERSAKQGYGLGMKNLGMCYQYGEGCEEDMAAAVTWYEKSLEVTDDLELAQKLPGYRDAVRAMQNTPKKEPELPAGYEDAMSAFADADAYERELYDNGMLPGSPAPASKQGRIGAENYPRIGKKAAEGDERAVRIFTILGWTVPDRQKETPKEKQAEQKGETPMATVSKDPRTNIGGFFTIVGTPGLLMANVQSETYKEGDTLTTLFDTTGGRQPEMALFGGIANGLEIRVTKLPPQPIGDDIIKSIMEKTTDDDALKSILAQKPGIGVMKLDGGKEGCVYFIFTRKGVFSGTVDGATKTELQHYDQVLASALPCEDSGSGNPPAAAEKPVQAEQSRKSENKESDIRDACIRKMDDFLNMISKEIKEADERIQKQKRVEESIHRIQSDPDVHEQEEKAEQAQKALRDAQAELRREEETLASLGLFALGKKNECRLRIEAAKKHLPELEASVRQQKNKLQEAKKRQSENLARAKASQAEILDLKEWNGYYSRLCEQRKQVLKQKEELSKGAGCSFDPTKWNAPTLPKQPAVEQKPLDDDTLRTLLEDTVMLWGPITITDIQKREPRLQQCSTIKLSSMLRSMAITIKQERVGVTTYYSMR